MKFVIFHGSFGSPESNWIPYLKRQLESLHQEVIVPGFPVDNWDELTTAGEQATTKNQNLANWFKTFDQFYPRIKNEKIVFVGHSLGPLFFLHLLDKQDLKVDSAIFVAPFLAKLHKLWQIDAANSTFYKDTFDFDKLKKLIPVSYVIYSDNDPYVDEKYSLEFAEKLNSKKILVKGAKHMNTETGLFEFPLVLDLCKSRL